MTSYWRSILGRGAVGAALAACSLAIGPAALGQESQSPINEIRRLAELLGGSHYLRITCAGRDDQRWRRMMVDFLDVEAPTEGSRRASLVRAFNNGYTREERRYPFCDDTVRAQEAQLAAEGRQLAERLRDRYLD